MSVTGGDVLSYNSGNVLDNLKYGGNGAAEIGSSVFGSAGAQSIDPRMGGNAIMQHQQRGGSRRRRSGKKSASKKRRHARKTKVVLGGSKRKSGRKSGKKTRKARRSRHRVLSKP
jgi:hypothetical protein